MEIYKYKIKKNFYSIFFWVLQFLKINLKNNIIQIKIYNINNKINLTILINLKNFNLWVQKIIYYQDTKNLLNLFYNFKKIKIIIY